MPTIVHFDISAEEPERARRFYETLFGWKITPLPGPVPYHLIETADSEGSPGVGGGVSQRSEGEKGGITNFIGVDSIESYIAKVEEDELRAVDPELDSFWNLNESRYTFQIVGATPGLFITPGFSPDSVPSNDSTSRVSFSDPLVAPPGL